MKQETKTPAPLQNKEDFIAFIDKRLTGLSFTKDSEKEIWINERNVQSSPRTIVINGQRHDQPGETHYLKFEVEVFGEGGMKDVDTEIVKSFVEVNFNVYQDNQDVSEWPTFCMFFDDQFLFDSLLNKIFGL